MRENNSYQERVGLKVSHSLNKIQSQPKYRIVENHLRALILSGEAPVDSLLPTEKTLCTRFGISRATVRTALANIQAEGLIVRHPAIGSRVISAVKRQAFTSGWNSVEDLLQYTKNVRLHVTTVGEVVLDETLAAEIGFGVGRSVVRIEGVRWTRDRADVPVCYVEIWFDSLFDGIVDQIGTSDVPIADLIDDRYQVRIESIRQEIFAASLSPATAEALDAVADSPSLEIRRWYADADGRMFQMTRSQYPADRFRYVAEFGRRQP